MPVVTDYEIWKNNPEKVIRRDQGMGREIPQHASGRHQGPVSVRRCGSTPKPARIARKPPHDPVALAVRWAPTSSVIANSMTGTFEYVRQG